jgi:pimeloyl-ACP methyl ester carboxylesterase
VLLLEYPGYGARSGSVGEESIVADTTESLRAAVKQFGPPLIVVGESLGAGVAAATVSRGPESIDAVVLFTPWDTLPNLAAQRFWFVPARLLVTDRYDSISNLSKFPGPISIYIAEHDEVIPRTRSEALFASLTGNKSFHIIPNRSHNTWPDKFDRKMAREIVRQAKKD